MNKKNNALIKKINIAICDKKFDLAKQWLLQLQQDADGLADIGYISAYVYLQIGDEKMAIHEAKQALLNKSTFDAELYMIIGFAKRRLAKYCEAIEALEEANAIVLAENNEVSSNEFIGRNLLSLGQMYLYLGDINQAKAAYLSASKIHPNLRDKREAYSSYLICLHYDDAISNKEIFLQHLEYNNFFDAEIHPFADQNYQHKKIRVAYISPDFRRHVMCFFYQAFLRNYNKERFEVYCYCLNEEDEITTQFKGFVDSWQNVMELSPRAVAELIHNDEIDILFDLAGHSANNALPILKYHPANVQISGLGYFNTTGLKEVDYFLTDRYIALNSDEDYLFTEKLIKLQNSQFCYKPWDDIKKAKVTPCMERGYITFGCFNKYAKITDAVIMAWKNILANVKNSKLVLKSMIYCDAKALETIKIRFITMGIDIGRIEFRPSTSNYLDELLDIDIILDTFPYPGGGMTCDALYMGVPVITLEGERHGARFASSILSNAGLGELIAKNSDMYIERAIALAGDYELLNILHKNLRTMLKVSPIMDANAYMTEIENIYQIIMAKKWSEENGTSK